MVTDIFARRPSRILVNLVKANAEKIDDDLIRRASKLGRDNDAHYSSTYLLLTSTLEGIGYTLSSGYGREKR